MDISALAKAIIGELNIALAVSQAQLQAVAQERDALKAKYEPTPAPAAPVAPKAD